jgi:hypothetical protein
MTKLELDALDRALSTAEVAHTEARQRLHRARIDVALTTRVVIDAGKKLKDACDEYARTKTAG